MPYRGHTVEISGRLLPKGKVPYPTLVVEKIVQLRDPNIEPIAGANRWPL